MEEKDLKIDFTVEELQEAVECYNLLLPSEVEQAYKQLLIVPDFGVRVAQAFQRALKMCADGKLPQNRVLDAAVLPAFLIGQLMGMAKAIPAAAPTLPEGHSPGPCRACGKVLCDIAFPQRPAQPWPLESVSFEDQMKTLQTHIGKDIYVEFVDYGRPYSMLGELRMVEPYKVIFLKTRSCPFIGSGCAIRSIHAVQDSLLAEALYHNPSIPADYDIRDMKQVEALRVQCFGASHA